MEAAKLKPNSMATSTPIATRPTSPRTLRTLVVLVEDLPGVLNRVASLFRRRTFNIVSLNVGQTHEPGVSRMTIVVEADADTSKRIEANLYKIVNVLRVDDISDQPSVLRNIALIKIAVGFDDRAKVLQVCEVFRARVVDIGTDSLAVEITGTQDKIDGLVAVLAEYGIAEMVQSGAIAMTRGTNRVTHPNLTAVDAQDRDATERAA